MPKVEKILFLNNVIVYPFARSKLVWVLLDQYFQYQTCIGKAVKKEFLATLALK